jgi:maleate isomerase
MWHDTAARESRDPGEETTMWQPDGWGWRARIGVLTPRGDVGPEAEFRVMAPEGVSIHAARVPLDVHAPGARGTMDRVIAHDAVCAFAKPPLVDDA